MTFPQDLLDSLRTARHIAVLTGAGVSAESGVPTFRDAQSALWANFNPADLATPQAFERDPQRVSRWYDRRRCDAARCLPNPGHAALAQLQRRTLTDGRQFTLITQNVDRLHQSAGSTDVIELHGSLFHWRCTRCNKETEELGPAFATHPPPCPCGGHKRPGVVWFGEILPTHALSHAQHAAASCDLLLSLGTSSRVHPAAGLIDLAPRHYAKVLEVNPDNTPYTSRANWAIAGKTGKVLPELIAEALKTEM